MSKKPYTWLDPKSYGATGQDRLARPWLYHGLLVEEKVKVTDGVKAHLARIASEIAFLENLQEVTR